MLTLVVSSSHWYPTRRDDIIDWLWYVGINPASSLGGDEGAVDGKASASRPARVSMKAAVPKRRYLGRECSLLIQCRWGGLMPGRGPTSEAVDSGSGSGYCRDRQLSYG
jgi:hypothetical protein